MMKAKKWVLWLLLALLLSGCAPEAPADTLPSHPTLPEFTPELSPAQQLQAALEKTGQAQSLTLCFGTDDALSTQTVTVTEGVYTSLLVSPRETVYYQGNTGYRLEENESVTEFSQEQPFTRQQIFEEVYRLFPDGGLIERFCAQPLTASPSIDGSFCYQLTELTGEEIHQLLYGEAPQTALSQEGIGAVAFTVNPEGCFSQLLISFYLPQTGKTHTLRLTLTEINQTPTITPPTWLP